MATMIAAQVPKPGGDFGAKGTLLVKGLSDAANGQARLAPGEKTTNIAGRLL